MAKLLSKITETRDELSTTYNPKIMSRCLSAPDATLHHCLKNKQQSNMVFVVRIQVSVLFTVEDSVATCT